MTLLVVQALVPCVRNARRIIQSMRESGYNLERAQLICNRIGRGSSHLSVDDVTESLGLSLFATIPDDWDVASGAINLGEPLLSYSPKSKLRIAIQEIAERLHAPDSQADERGGSKHGLIGRIFAGS
jgi:Flp pilus assembly CpaE family ATPase